MSALEVMIPADIRFPLERANGVQILKTAAALARAGAHTTLLVRQSDPRGTQEILALYGLAGTSGLEVRRLPVLHRTGSYLLPRASYLVRATQAAVGALQRGAVVLTRDLQLADLLLRFGQRPIVYEAHALEAVMYRERGTLYGSGEPARPHKAARLARREGRVWRRAAGLVTTTAGIRDSFAALYGPRPHVSVIPNGCDVTLTAFPGLADAPQPRILYAGQLYPWKGIDVLVRALPDVAGARLVVAGGLPGERDLERVRALVARLGLAERVELLGTIPQVRVAAELARASVVTVPFLRSGMTEAHTSPLKAFEAMAAGRPIVASDLPSSREVLEHGRSALLVPPGDVEALAGALRRLLTDRGLAERLARAAFADAPRYSWDARARSLRELLEGVR